MNKLSISIFVLLVSVACSKSSPSEQPITANHSLPQHPVEIMNVPVYEKAPFSVDISVPNQLKSNEEFTVEANLKNLTDDNVKIQHAAGLFYFTIKDSNGKGINTFVMPMVGIIRIMQGKGEITEQYKYKLDKPGYYEISATAKFSIGEGEKRKDFKLETNKASIEVTQ
jgi:hypothetical protein